MSRSNQEIVESDLLFGSHGPSPYPCKKQSRDSRKERARKLMEAMPEDYLKKQSRDSRKRQRPRLHVDDRPSHPKQSRDSRKHSLRAPSISLNIPSEAIKR